MTMQEITRRKALSAAAGLAGALATVPGQALAATGDASDDAELSQRIAAYKAANEIWDRDRRACDEEALAARKGDPAASDAQLQTLETRENASCEAYLASEDALIAAPVQTTRAMLAKLEALVSHNPDTLGTDAILISMVRDLRRMAASA